MASGYNTKLPHKHGYPGEGYYYILCDICGTKIRAKDSVLITDKFNYYKNMVVCKADADKTNPQEFIKITNKEKQVSDPKMIRSEGTDTFGSVTDPSGIGD